MNSNSLPVGARYHWADREAVVVGPREDWRDLFGRPMVRYWAQDVNSPRQGWLTFGPDVDLPFVTEPRQGKETEMNRPQTRRSNPAREALEHHVSGAVARGEAESIVGIPQVTTATGRTLTDADVQALADEAERGYDVSLLAPRRAPGGDGRVLWALAWRRRSTGLIVRHLVDARAPMLSALCGVKVSDGTSRPLSQWLPLETNDRAAHDQQCPRCRALGRDRLADYLIRKED